MTVGGTRLNAAKPSKPDERPVAEDEGRAIDRELDEALKETFRASDPIAVDTTCRPAQRPR